MDRLADEADGLAGMGGVASGWRAGVRAPRGSWAGFAQTCVLNGIGRALAPVVGVGGVVAGCFWLLGL